MTETAHNPANKRRNPRLTLRSLTEQTIRRWGVVPPPPYDSGEPFDGYRLLVEEQSRPDRAAALFTALRRALYYAPTSFDGPTVPEHAWRGETVPEIAGLPLLLGPGFAQRTPDEVTDACLDVAAVLSTEDRPFSVRAFTRAAAIVSPDRADASLAAARAMLDTGERSHAEIWLRRAVTGARRTTQWRPYTEAHLELADVLLADKQMEEADRMLTKALRAARRYHLHDLTTRAHLLTAWVEMTRAAGASAGDAGRLRTSARKHLALAERSQAKARRTGLGFTPEIHDRTQAEQAHIEAALAMDAAAGA